MLVHRMVKDIKNSKVLHKIKTKDAYTAQQLYQQFKSQHLLDDRREYDEEDLMSAYPGLSKEEAKKLFDMLQRSTDAADLSLSKDNLIDAMGSGYTPVHVQKNRQGVFIVFKSDKDGKFYIVEKRSKQLFSVATSLAMAKRIIGETEDSKSKDADPRGYKVSDQIIKGFLIYKSGKGPATFFAKNENGKEFEGTMEQIKKQIDDYWVKQDEDVMKQKVRDSKTKDAFQGVATAKPGKYFSGYNKQEKSPLFDNEKDAKEWCAFRMQRQDAKHISKCEVVKTSDSKTKGKAYHPRWRIKDDKLFRLRSAIKKAKTKDVELSNRAVWRKEDFDKMVSAGNFTIVSKQPWGYEVKVKSGNIYGVEVKDSYTKGSADKKTKDVNLMFEFLIKIVKEGTGVSTSVAEKAVSKLLDAEGPISAGVDNSVIIRKAKKYLPSKDSFTYTKGSADKKTKDQINPEYIRKRKILVDQLERAKKNRAPIETVENITDMIKKLDEDYDRGSAKDKYTGDPLTKKGQKIMSAMKEKYGKKKGESVFYASKNKGTISGVDGKTRDYRQPKTVKYKGFEIDPYFGQFSDGDIGDETYLIYKNNKLVVSKEFYTVEEAKAYIDKKYK